ncbi:hypothetical protein GCM10009681_13650 [Luedemannella helvata]|uniref:Uncharacterized protein n=1 Tax=Luedemannella helvata TaxID=349315 RepID=A0ABN2JYW0_9ACTN
MFDVRDPRSLGARERAHSATGVRHNDAAGPPGPWRGPGAAGARATPDAAMAVFIDTQQIIWPPGAENRRPLAPPDNAPARLA